MLEPVHLVEFEPARGDPDEAQPTSGEHVSRLQAREHLAEQRERCRHVGHVSAGALDGQRVDVRFGQHVHRAAAHQRLHERIADAACEVQRPQVSGDVARTERQALAGRERAHDDLAMAVGDELGSPRRTRRRPDQRPRGREAVAALERTRGTREHEVERSGLLAPRAVDRDLGQSELPRGAHDRRVVVMRDDDRLGLETRQDAEGRVARRRGVERRQRARHRQDRHGGRGVDAVAARPGDHVAPCDSPGRQRGTQPADVRGERRPRHRLSPGREQRRRIGRPLGEGEKVRGQVRVVAVGHRADTGGSRARRTAGR